MIPAAYNELLNKPKSTITVVESESATDYDCYILTVFPTLSSLVDARISDAEYVHVELLWEPETNARVFNLMFFDADAEIVGGCELTSTAIFWDDDEGTN